MAEGQALQLEVAGLQTNGRTPGGVRELERREGVLRLARQEERQGDAATDRGRVGAGLPGRHADALPLRRRREGLAALREPGRRGLPQGNEARPQRQRKRRARLYGSGAELPAQRLRAV